MVGISGIKHLFLAGKIMIICCSGFPLNAQTTSQITDNFPDTSHTKEALDHKYERDLTDLFLILLKKPPDSRLDSSMSKYAHYYFTVSPILEYTMATKFSFGIVGNMAFTARSSQKTNVSSFLGAIKYTQNKQFMLPVQSSIWTPGNKYNLLGDWRYLNYPEDNWGFGGFTTLSDKYIINYHQLRLYETILRSIRKNVYFGFGYQLNHYWRISESVVQPGRITDFQKYGFSEKSTSSGVVLDFIYDSRENSINPEGGSFYLNVQLLQDIKLLGADSNWNSLLIDVRKYIKMPHHTILAFWFYNMFTISGDPPYLDLPGTGSDTYSITGRGYEQTRFIGKKMVYLEAEYRFNISKNGLIGAVIFANAESLSELDNNKLEVILPGFGVGLRFKLDKFSGTNVAIDYGIGTRGSRGFSSSLGEVF
jgi:hypothetical protein